MEEFTSAFRAARCVSTPLVAIRSADPASTTHFITENLKQGQGLPVMLGWDVVRGLYAICRDSGEELARVLGERQAASIGPVDALLVAQQLGDDGLLLYSNAHRFWHDPGVMQGIWDLRDSFKATGRMLVLLAAPGATLPQELGQDVLILDEPLPSTSHLEQIVRETFNAAKLDEPELPVIVKAVDALIGLAAFPAEQALAMSLVKRQLDTEDLWERKRQIIEQTPGLSVWRGGETFEDIGGVENVKSFLRAVLAGVDPPRVVVFIDEIEKAFAGTGTDLSGVKTEMTGTILTYMQDREADGTVFIGPPGSAKSVTAKATGGTAGIPTIAFDLPAMESSLVGASTERLRTALQIIDAVSQGRMLFIATCNSIASLPPELRRRFTLGTFFFDLPTAEERETIWGIYLKKYNVSRNLPNDEGWTGAEIKECCRKAHRLGMTLVQAAKYIVPVSRSAAEQIKALRQMASGKFINASTPGVYQYQENQSVPRGRVIRDLEGPLTVMPPSRSEA
jgi:hypothetical protein